MIGDLMAYTKTTWVDGGPPAINAANLNKLEQGVSDAATHTHTGTYDPAGAAAAAVTSHHAASSTDHDDRYYTETEIDTALSGKENTGVAASAVTSHEGATDPHTQYVEGTGLTLWAGTQTAYDAIGVKDSSTVYVIT